MNLTQFAIEKNRITYMVLGTIITMGLVLYQSLPRDSMPPMTIRVASVVSSFPGAGPERVEQLVTDKIEKVAQELPELKKLKSTSRTGLSVVNVTLKDEVAPEKLQDVWDELRRKINTIQGLPEGVVPHLDDEGVGDVYGVVVGLTSDGYTYVQMKEYADDIKDDLIKLDDAAKVELGGIQDERVFVEFDNTRLKEYGLSAGILRNTIASTNIVSSGGQINYEDERIVLEPTGNFNSVEDIRKTLIPVGNGQVIHLEDITTINKGYITPPTQKVRVNGKDAISLYVSLKDNANIIVLGEEVNRIVAKWKKKLPVGLELSRLSSMDRYIDFKIADFMSNLIQSISIVFIVMLFFLGMRTGIIISSLIPIVVIMTFMVMGISNIGINQVSLAALIMALGMMVDNGIVVAETIMVKMEEGIAARKAAIDACSELFTPLLISTLTTSAAFLSFYLAESAMGDIVGPIFLVITIALLSSWFISLTITTLFCYLFMKVLPKGEAKLSIIDRSINWLKSYYNDLIIIALNHKSKVLLGIVGALFIAIFGFTKIEFLFFPASDRNMITVDINLPLGTKIERTGAIVEKIDDYIAGNLQINDQRQEGIVDWSSYIGQGPESYDQGYSKDEANSSYAHILVNTSRSEINQEMINRLDAFCFANFPNADIKVGTLAAGRRGGPY